MQAVLRKIDNHNIEECIALRVTREQGVCNIKLSTKESNKNAISLYHKFGFRENGEMNDEEIVLQLIFTEKSIL